MMMMKGALEVGMYAEELYKEIPVYSNTKNYPLSHLEA